MKYWNRIVLLVLFGLIALLASLQENPTGESQFAGQKRVVGPPYRLAGLSLGMTESEVEARMGLPGVKREQQWKYESDGATLDLTFLKGRVLAIGGSGRWTFEDQNGPLPGWMSPLAKIKETFGEPSRSDGYGQVYSWGTGELTFQIRDNIVDHVWIVGRTD